MYTKLIFPSPTSRTDQSWGLPPSLCASSLCVCRYAATVDSLRALNPGGVASAIVSVVTAGLSALKRLARRTRRARSVLFLYWIRVRWRIRGALCPGSCVQRPPRRSIRAEGISSLAAKNPLAAGVGQQCTQPSWGEVFRENELPWAKVKPPLVIRKGKHLEGASCPIRCLQQLLSPWAQWQTWSFAART